MKRKHTVGLSTEKSRHGGSNAKWMLYYKCQCAPLVLDIKGFLHAFRGKEEHARVEVDANVEYCAKVAKKRGHLPAQATTTLAGCERPA